MNPHESAVALVGASIVVPHGNSLKKNAAMRALGIDLIERGEDFQAAKEYARALAEEQSLRMVPSYHPLLVAGVATYCLELLRLEVAKSINQENDGHEEEQISLRW